MEKEKAKKLENELMSGSLLFDEYDFEYDGKYLHINKTSWQDDLLYQGLIQKLIRKCNENDVFFRVEKQNEGGFKFIVHD